MQSKISYTIFLRVLSIQYGIRSRTPSQFCFPTTRWQRGPTVCTLQQTYTKTLGLHNDIWYTGVVRHEKTGAKGSKRHSTFKSFRKKSIRENSQLCIPYGSTSKPKPIMTQYLTVFVPYKVRNLRIFEPKSIRLKIE